MYNRYIHIGLLIYVTKRKFLQRTRQRVYKIPLKTKYDSVNKLYSDNMYMYNCLVHM